MLRYFLLYYYNLIIIMHNFKCIYGHKSTSICTNPDCHQNAFICRTCRNEQCFIKHGHDRQHIMSLRTLQEYFQVLNRNKLPNQQIYQRVLKQYKKLKDMVQEQFQQFLAYKNKLYGIPQEIRDVKTKLNNGNFQQIQSKDLYQYIQFCKEMKQLPDLKLHQYIQYQQKVAEIRNLQSKLFQVFKNLYHIPKIDKIRKIKLIWNNPGQDWEIDQNLYINTKNTNSILISKQFFKNGIFEIQIDAKVNSNIHFGLSLRQSPLILKGPTDIKFPLEIQKTYTYHIDASGRIYHQDKQIQKNFLKGKNNDKYTRLKIIFDTNQGYIKWFNDNQFQDTLQNIELQNGVYAVLSIDKKGQIKSL